MSRQLIKQAMYNLREVVEKSRLLNGILDIHEMRERIKNAFESLLINCSEARGPLVSIVIPTRNESRRLPLLLYSLRASCYKNIEVIVADYMSVDDTPRVAKLYGARVVHLDKPGIGYATYVGVIESKGEIIIRTDADAIIPKNIISLVVKSLLEKDNKLIAHIGHVYYDGGFIENLMAFYYDKYLRKPWNTTRHFIAFKRDIVERGLNFNPRLRYDEDYDFGYRVYRSLGSRVIYYDWYNSVLVSARRIMATGLIRYVLGFRER